MMQVFHEGEIALQRREDMHDKLAAIGPRLIRNFMPEQHMKFFGQLPFILVGAVDVTGQPWTSILASSPGFIESPDQNTLVIHARFSQADPLKEILAVDLQVGLLGIEPHTRRRNRANGVVERVFDNGFQVRVQQSFGNCPRYIHTRKATYAAPRFKQSPKVEHLNYLDDGAMHHILNADTFFIASAHPTSSKAVAQGVDVSHRGGLPGFVRIDHHNALIIEDYKGNSFFNTLGNIALNPRAGLLFIDYAMGNLLYLAVDASVEWQDGPSISTQSGTKRFLHFDIRQLTRIHAALPLHWEQAIP